jgi:NAD(P)-dependent dehydrogenase (short-subunit alcohol dehydrogenase family)
MATPYDRTIDGFETQFGTCHIGHFLLFQLLKPTLLKSSTPEFNSRVVSVSSIGHRSAEIRFHDFNFENKEEYTPWAAYGQAKTANIYFANEIERRYGEKGLHALSLHPGGIATGLQVHLDASFHEMMRSNPAVVKGMMNTEQGAATTIYAAVSKEWEGRGGKYLSKCIEQKPVESKPAVLGDDGYSAWAYDAEKEGRLWKESLKMVRMDDDSTAL